MHDAMLALCHAGQPKPSDRERQRLSFFQSLRKSSSGGNSSTAAQPASNGEAAAAADERLDQARAAEQHSERQHVVKQELPEASDQEPASSSMLLGSIDEGGEQAQSAGVQADRRAAGTPMEQQVLEVSNAPGFEGLTHAMVGWHPIAPDQACESMLSRVWCWDHSKMLPSI